VINSDETGYRTGGDKRWLWALVAANFVFYNLIYALRNGPGESGSAVDHLVTPETLG
jgi:hypothetical protein